MWSMLVFAASLLALLYFGWLALRAWRSPELKEDLERLRQQRRARKAASRKRL
ncbi:MAG TPA: hypothetical protein VMV59_04620 [Candidatus Dormibacteraeota bacterium]|nr:hypothetical protein [Candidatus Dormibacteraeota bacterium]